MAVDSFDYFDYFVWCAVLSLGLSIEVRCLGLGLED